ncbi:MAG: hypothetical protein B7X06_02515, partial [Verrucomicrobia bacterium 21-51-4]
NTIFKTLSSLRLTVLLLGAAMALVFLGTLEQVHLGIHEVQRRYFGTWLAYIPWPGQDLAKGSGWGIILPGGYTLGVLFLVNLVLAHFRYFKPSWSKVGIVCIHAGIVLLIISGFVSGLTQTESQMVLETGVPKNYSYSTQDNELVLVDTTLPSKDIVYSFPIELVHNGALLEAPGMPFKLKVIAFHPNADLVLRAQMPNAPANLADRGAGIKMDIGVMPKPIDYAPESMNTATAYVEVLGAEGPEGTWLISNLMDERFPKQAFELDGRSYAIALRWKRYYYPYAFTLNKFTHERYPGTEIPKHFSSEIELNNPQTGEQRTVLISMNEPLRYAGQAFYQASFTEGERVSILQVVSNPGWALPYWAVGLVSIGLLAHFCLSLRRYLKQS